MSELKCSAARLRERISSECPLTVAIDGPSGSGKSTIARNLAAQLELDYLDTGAMYRALTWYCLDQDLPLDDHAAVAGAADSFPLELTTNPLDFRVAVGGVDVTEQIRQSAISEQVSAVATNLDVRQALVRRQREIIEQCLRPTGRSMAQWEAAGGAAPELGLRRTGRGVVAEGRDITTVVAPDADLRLLLTASERARLQRRALQLHGSAEADEVERTRSQVVGRDAKDSTVVDFFHAAEGVVALDSSAWTIEQTLEHIYGLIYSILDERSSRGNASQEEARARVMRAALAEYELTPDDDAVLAGEEGDEEPSAVAAGLPVLAIVGRPNVGKSTLVNRIIQRRAAVVQDTPGVTRDRVSYQANWMGRDFTVVDTGGWELDARGLDRSVAQQAEVAIELADAVLFVVDANVGATSTDEHLMRVLRRCGKPVILAANKVDSAAQEADVAYLWSLGLGEPYPVSALHGRGSGDLLDAVMEVLPQESAQAQALPQEGVRRVALVGRPNVGKSSLLNALAKEERVVVNDLAGTTRDPVDELVYIDSRPWWFVDTAGIRRKMHRSSGADYYASIRTQAALEKAEVALVLLDASQPLSEQDVRIVQQAVDAGRALVIINNKWDLVDEDRRLDLRSEHARDLAHVSWASTINISAKTTWHTNRLVGAIDRALEGWSTRVSTGKLNSFLGELVAAHPHPVRGGKQPRILFATQAGTRPPRFVIFTTGFLDPGYRRFIERRLRETFGFQGSPIQISVRVREKRKK